MVLVLEDLDILLKTLQVIPFLPLGKESIVNLMRVHLFDLCIGPLKVVLQNHSSTKILLNSALGNLKLSISQICGSLQFLAVVCEAALMVDETRV